MSDRRTPVVFDIETAPDMAWIESTREKFIETLSPPATHKYPEALERWYRQKVDDRVERAALSPLEGCVTAFACAPLWDRDDAAPTAYVDRDDEAALIVQLMDSLQFAADGGAPQLAGFNVVEFDIPFITQRAAVHSIRLPKWWPVNPRRYGAVMEARDILEQGRLATWLDRFSLPPKLGDGKDAPNMTDEQLLEYVRNDVVVERSLLRRLSFVSPEIYATNPDHQ